MNTIKLISSQNNYKERMKKYNQNYNKKSNNLKKIMKKLKMS